MAGDLYKFKVASENAEVIFSIFEDLQKIMEVIDAFVQTENGKTKFNAIYEALGNIQTIINNLDELLKTQEFRDEAEKFRDEVKELKAQIDTIKDDTQTLRDEAEEFKDDTFGLKQSVDTTKLDIDTIKTTIDKTKTEIEKVLGMIVENSEFILTWADKAVQSAEIAKNKADEAKQSEQNAKQSEEASKQSKNEATAQAEIATTNANAIKDLTLQVEALPSSQTPSVEFNIATKVVTFKIPVVQGEMIIDDTNQSLATAFSSDKTVKMIQSLTKEDIGLGNVPNYGVALEPTQSLTKVAGANTVYVLHLQIMEMLSTLGEYSKKVAGLDKIIKNKLGKDEKAKDSDKLDGLDSSQFSKTEHSHDDRYYLKLASNNLYAYKNATNTSQGGLKVRLDGDTLYTTSNGNDA